MRILCCLDGTNSEQVQKTITALSTGKAHTLGLLYVTDERPREVIAERRQGLRGPRLPGNQLRLDERMRQAEESAAQDILLEGQGYLPQAELLHRAGVPERVIVNTAAQWGADLILISAHSGDRVGPPLGPRSVGHAARFVLDHAPCSVLLIRPDARAAFPLA